MKPHKLFLGLGLAFILAMLALIGVVSANPDTTLYVNSELDEPWLVSSSTCESTPSKVCTLRAAVMLANNRPGKDVIQVKNGTYNLTRSGIDENAINGDLDLTDDVDIIGAGRGITFIDGQNKNRIFHVQPGVKFYLTNFTLRNARTNVNSGSAIRSEGVETTLRFLIVKNNRGGAAISNNYGSLSLTYMDINNNNQDSLPGSGGVESLGPLTVDDSLIHNNHGFAGGGLLAFGTTRIQNSTISGNKADHRGGGILLGNGSGAGVFHLSNVTITGNRTNLNNEFESGGGAGVYSIYQNDIVYVRNSIIAGNVDEGFGQGHDTQGNDCYGFFTTDGYNFIGDAYNCLGFNDGFNGDQVGSAPNNKDPLLLPLAKNGGFTMTHALADNSPAIDAGNPQNCRSWDGSTLATDQRGYVRHANAHCDIGAFEYASPGKPTPTADPCSVKPAVPTLQQPANNGQTNKRKVALDWNGVICATKYKVLVKQDATNGPKADKGTVQPSSFITDKLKKGHDYYWRVKACSDKGCSKSGWFKFTITK
jgi:hypothetical protein